MANLPNNNFFKCHEALHELLSQILPSLQNAIDLWHQKATQTIPPCATPSQCPQNKKPSRKNKSCQGCINWATAIEAEVYPPSAIGSLQWRNANPTLFSKDPLEVIKLFVLHIPPNQTYSKLGDFDVASLLMLMSKFKDFHHGDQVIVDRIQKVSDIRNFLAHLKLTKKIDLDDITFSGFWSNITNLVDSLEGLRRQYFIRQVAQELRGNLSKIKDQTISPRTERETLRPLVEESPQPNPILEQRGELGKYQEELRTRYKRERGGVRLIPGKKPFPMKKYFVDLNFQEEIDRTPTSVNSISYSKCENMLKIKRGKDNNVRQVLITGKAGSGKSITISNLAFNWATVIANKTSQGNKLSRIFARFDLVFALDLCNMVSETSLVETIQQQLLPFVPSDDLASYLQKNSGKCLFLLDGYDELENAFKESDICILLYSNVIVTSRSDKVGDFWDVFPCFDHVHLNGFTVNNTHAFIRKFFTTHRVENGYRKQIIEQNICSSGLLSFQSSPLLLAMLCLSLEDSAYNSSPCLSKSLTEIYMEAVVYFNNHFRSKRRKQHSTSSLNNQDLRKLLRNLGSVAFDGLVANELHFSNTEFANDVLEKARSLGLVYGVQKSFNGEDGKIAFFHKTFQEFCASVHLCHLFQTDKEKFEKDFSGIVAKRETIINFEYLLRFCCGLERKVAHYILEKVESLSLAEIAKNKDWMKHFSCGSKDSHKDLWLLPLTFLFENMPQDSTKLIQKQQEYLKTLVSTIPIDDTIADSRQVQEIIYRHSILPVNTRVGLNNVEEVFLCVTSKQPIIDQILTCMTHLLKIHLIGQNSDKPQNHTYDYSSFLQKFSSNPSQIREFHCTKCKLTGPSLSGFLSRQTHLKKLKLRSINFSYSDWNRIPFDKLKQLESIDLSCNQINQKGIKTLLRSLHCFKNLKILSLGSIEQISSNCIQMIFQSLHVLPKLASLSIHNTPNDICSQSVLTKFTLEFLTSNTCSDCNTNDEDARVCFVFNRDQIEHIIRLTTNILPTDQTRKMSLNTSQTSHIERQLSFSDN